MKSNLRPTILRLIFLVEGALIEKLSMDELIVLFSLTLIIYLYLPINRERNRKRKGDRFKKK